ncbi:hypothetical protein CWI39_1474p0010 [Hamiltosporidium magnivora]|uniref:Uncharacterized protein n=1 Tax=Hamiltosporidium magnivora TaxID=148818 RepID=A0A4Q9L182_9MICR|nr:hypothetical protein CWI39_1474p0010 [Hamiltosporidium magnivora]
MRQYRFEKLLLELKFVNKVTRTRTKRSYVMEKEKYEYSNTVHVISKVEDYISYEK